MHKKGRHTVDLYDAWCAMLKVFTTAELKHVLPRDFAVPPTLYGVPVLVRGGGGGRGKERGETCLHGRRTGNPASKYSSSIWHWPQPWDPSCNNICWAAWYCSVMPALCLCFDFCPYLLILVRCGYDVFDAWG